MFSGHVEVTTTLRDALLLSVAVHFLFLFFGERVVDQKWTESGVAEKKLQVLGLPTQKLDPSVAVRSAAPKNRRIQEQGPAMPVVATQRSTEVAPKGDEIYAENSKPLPGTSIRAEKIGNPTGVVAPSLLPAVKPDIEAVEGYADAVRGYRMALAMQARRFRVYPATAQEMGVGGRSEIEVIVPASALPELSLKRTSGHRELDLAALDMLRRSAAVVALPPLLRGGRFSFSLPVEFLPEE